jgi:hypothetical protein
LHFQKKGPITGRLVKRDLAQFGLRRGDKLVPCGAIVDIHDVEGLDVLPATLFFFRSDPTSQLSGLSGFVGIDGIFAGLQGFNFSRLQFDVLHTVDQGSVSGQELRFDN